MDENLPRPASPMAFFLACTSLALQGFGGVLPVTQRELVERRRWISRERFLELLSVAQVLPGPNVVNLLIMLGHGYFGWRGAAAGVAGILAAPLLIVVALAAAAAQWQASPVVTGALRGMGVVAAGLALSTAWKLAPGLRSNAMGRVASAAGIALTFAAVGLLRWPLVWVVLGLGAAGIALAWRRLGP